MREFSEVIHKNIHKSRIKTELELIEGNIKFVVILSKGINEIEQTIEVDKIYYYKKKRPNYKVKIGINEKECKSKKEAVKYLENTINGIS